MDNSLEKSYEREQETVKDSDGLDSTQRAVLEWAYGEWRKGKLYRSGGDFYEVGTDEYICPDS